MVVYVLATLLATRRVRRPLRRSLAVTSAVGLGLFIGLGRIYLGHDWPTDVLAGWLLAGGVVCTAYGSLLLVDSQQTSRQRRMTIGSRPRPAH
jgi:membrane-associated phospholipid phosphatase